MGRPGQAFWGWYVTQGSRSSLFRTRNWRDHSRRGTAVKNGVSLFQTLENLARKCTSVSIACPAAALTRATCTNTSDSSETGGRKRNMDIDVPKNVALRFEMEKWLEVQEKMNGGAWYTARHQNLTVVWASDASSRGWGGLIRCPGEEVFHVAGDFPDGWTTQHINDQEAYAIKQLLVVSTTTLVQGSTLVVDVDYQALFYAMKNGKSSDTCLHEIVTELFCK